MRSSTHCDPSFPTGIDGDYSKATGQLGLESQRRGSEMSQNAGSEEAERHGTRFSALFLGILSTQSRIGPGCLATVSLSYTYRNHRTEISSHELFFQKKVSETRFLRSAHPPLNFPEFLREPILWGPGVEATSAAAGRFDGEGPRQSRS